jgi:hypothetical protein
MMSRTATTHRDRTIVALIVFDALTLALMSTLHLTGAISGGKKPYDPTGAGIAEAIIGIVLIGGAAAVTRAPHRGRGPARAAVAFAILGFVVGLTFTLRGGSAVDIAYHATMLPVLIATGILLARSPRDPTARGSDSGLRRAADQRSIGDATLERRIPHA